MAIIQKDTAIYEDQPQILVMLMEWPRCSRLGTVFRVMNPLGYKGVYANASALFALDRDPATKRLNR